MARKSYYGEKYGRLLVIDKRELVERDKVLCSCDCGREKYVNISSLKQGKSKSCGCLQKEMVSKSNKVDLSGKKFGRLTVLYEAENVDKYIRWVCRCDCGNEISVRSSCLLENHTKSCGCLQKEMASKSNSVDLTGKKFGMLIAVEKVETNKFGGLMWKCLCDCGNEPVVLGWSLSAGTTKSCGCLRRKTFEQEMVGKKFGYLTILERFEYDYKNVIIWLCHCSYCNERVKISNDQLHKYRIACQKCTAKISGINKRIDITGNKYGLLTAIEPADKKRYWKFKCDCGNESVSLKSHVVSGKTKSCGCLKSFGELEVERILNYYKVYYIPQKTFKNCINIQELPFDFYIPDKNCCIEFDGEQHFRPVDYFGGEERFFKIQKYDAIKTIYCQQNNIFLLRIKYNEIDFIEDILMESGIIEENIL